MATNDIHVTVSDNSVNVPLSASSTRSLRSVNTDNGSPYYVGARAYVTQTANGAVITIIDKEGTTTANIVNGINGTNGTNGRDGIDGIDGVDGVGITSIEQNEDGTLTILLDNGSSYITEPLKGEDGYTPVKGVDYFDGEDGNGIASAVLNADYTLTLIFTDGTSVTTTSIRGEQGEQGVRGVQGIQGETGNGIASITKTGTVGLVDTYTITFTNGTTTTFQVTNGQDGAGSITDVTVNGVSVLDGSVAKVIVPTKVSDLTNDSGFITGYTETDPTVPSWAKASTKPTYTASEVGAQPTLVSGTNIKTINNQSLLGSGDITLASSGTSVPTANEVAEFDSTAHMNSTDMTASEVTDFVDSLDAQGANLADFVVEQGTEGIWTYRKWNSGISECWGIWNGSTTQYASLSYGGAYRVTGLAYPTNLFISAPILNYSAYLGGAFALTGTIVDTSDASAANFYIQSNQTGTKTTQIRAHAIGRWK